MKTPSQKILQTPYLFGESSLYADLVYELIF